MQQIQVLLFGTFWNFFLNVLMNLWMQNLWILRAACIFIHIYLFAYMLVYVSVYLHTYISVQFLVHYKCYEVFSSVQFICSVVSDSLRPHGLQHTRLPCPSPTPGAHSHSCLSSQWCHPTISSSVIPFSSRSVVSDSWRPHGLYSPWNSPGQNTGVGSRSLLQGIFPTEGSNPGLPHCRQILYQLSHKEAPIKY